MSTHPPVEDEKIEELTPQTEGYRSVLNNRNFLVLWVGQILSQLADRVVFVAFIAMIVHHFGPAESYKSYLYIAFTIPAIVLTAIAGVFVDRWPRRAVLVITNLLRAGFVFMLPWAAEQGNIFPLYALAFGLSAATQFFVPAEAATIPMIVRKTQLITANSLFTTTMMASVVFGFALGDPLINIFSLDRVHWPIFALFMLSAGTLCFVRTPPLCWIAEHEAENKPKTVGEGFRNFMAEMRDGLSYIRQNKVILRAMFKLALLFSVVVAVCFLFISFAKEFLYDNPEVAARKFAYIITYSGIGMVVGAFAVGKFCRSLSRGWMVYGGYTVIGVCLMLLGLIETFAKTDHVYTLPAIANRFFYLDEVRLTLRMFYTYFLATLMGAGAAFVAIPLQALLHELIPEDKRGKILGVQFTILSTCSTFPVLIAGLGAERMGTKPMFLAIGLLLLFLGIRGLYRRLRQVDAVTANW